MKSSSFYLLLFTSTVLFSCVNTEKEKAQIRKQIEDSIQNVQSLKLKEDSIKSLKQQLQKESGNNKNSRSVHEVKYRLSNIINYGNSTDYKWSSLTFMYGITNEITLSGSNSNGELTAQPHVIEKTEKTEDQETLQTFEIHYAVDKPIFTFILGKSGKPSTVTYYCKQTGENWKAEISPNNLP